MKANELSSKDLMIGDWVYNTHNQQNEQVQEIGSGLVMLNYNDLYEYDEIAPIPLTPEILKKNGFEYYHKNFASLSYDHQFKLKMEKWPDENGLGGLWSIIDLIKIRYVHELQQAMRMCSIEKEIIL